MAKILCVDDEPHVVTLKCAILEAAGHTVTASTSARDAIEKLQSSTYDAVVTDWRLGDANGRAVVSAAKGNSPFGLRRIISYQQTHQNVGINCAHASSASQQPRLNSYLQR